MLGESMPAKPRLKRKVQTAKWYGVKTVLRWFLKKSRKTTSAFEERVIVVKAKSFDHSIRLAELETRLYCKDDPGANFSIEPTGYYNSYYIGEPTLIHRAEYIPG